MHKELTVKTTSEKSDIVADALWGIGVDGVEIADPRDVQEVLSSSTNWDYVDDSVIVDSDIVVVKGFIECDNINEAVANFNAIIACTLGEQLSVEVNDIEERDWENGWKDFYSPVAVGKFVVVPEWLEADNDGRIAVKINPSTAFGTGAHESTQLCLKLLSEVDLSGKRVLDVGTGSGILGIAASLAGASDVYMTDIDPEAVKSAEENLELNGISRGVTVACADLLKGLDISAEVVTANLTADILGVLSKGIRAHMERGGILIASGIIDERKSEVVKIYSDLGFVMVGEERLGEWWGVKFVFAE